MNKMDDNCGVNYKFLSAKDRLGRTECQQLAREVFFFVQSNLRSYIKHTYSLPREKSRP